MKCPRCQEENGPTAKFCNGCGLRLDVACPACGQPNPPGSRFCNECGQRLDPAAPPGMPGFSPPASPLPQHLAEKIRTARKTIDEGERKQVTVLFADLKGSMDLLAEHDPEEARKLLDPVLEHMMEAVHRFEGTVNQIMGDGIMALFGAPLAHEDHAVRACYAALRLQASVRRYAEIVRRREGVLLQVRVGLNSGEVVVRSIGSDLHMDYTAVGQTTHLASRMEQLAAPGSILLTAESVRLAEGYVEVKPLGPMMVKGLSAPVETYELTGTGSARTRFQAMAARGLSRFVGRDDEMEQLRRILERVRQGRGQLVGIVGEPGVGKSRLVFEAVHSHRVSGWLVLESSSVSYGKATSYLPVIDLLKGYFKIGDGDSDREIREKLTGKILTLDRSLEPMLTPLLALLDVPVEDATWAALDPRGRRQLTLDAIRRLLLREAQVQPLLLVFEDLHWIDAETQGLLDALLDSLPTARILLLTNYRPEYTHTWDSKTYYTRLRLDTLPAESAGELLDALLGPDRSLAPLKALLAARTGGNPLFLEEGVRVLVETKVLGGERGSYRLTQPFESVRVPSTVHAILASRIDRLPASEKRLLQTAAVIGKDFSFAILQAIADDSEETLRHQLGHLQAAEFLYETNLFPDLEYTFKHALTHEVAYGSLVQDRRRLLHAQVAEALEAQYPDRVSEHAEKLAHHSLRGEVWTKAGGYLRAAGAKATARSAYREAVNWYEQGLLALRHLPQERETLRRAIDLHFDLRNALWPLGEPERLLEHLQAAKAVAETLDDRLRLGWVQSYLTQYYRMTGDPDRAIAAAQEALALAASTADFGLQVATSAHLGPIYRERGDFSRAIEILSGTVDALTGQRALERFGLVGLPAVLLRFHLVWCQAELGQFVDAGARAEEALRIAEESGSPYNLMFAGVGAGILSLFRGEAAQAIPRLGRGLELCRAWSMPILLPVTASTLGSAYALTGQLGEALPLLEQAVEHATTMKLMTARSLFVTRLGEGYLLAGRGGDAMRVAGESLALAREQKERGHEAYALRLQGSAVAAADPADLAGALRHYQEARSLAEALGMRPLLARIELDSGVVYGRSGERQSARRRLEAAVALYREMDLEFWLRRAETELASLG